MENVNLAGQPSQPQYRPNPIGSALFTAALGGGIQVGADYLVQKSRIKNADKLDEFVSKAKEIELNKPKTGARLLKTAELNQAGKVNWKGIARSAGLVAGLTFVGSMVLDTVFTILRAKKVAKAMAEAQAQQQAPAPETAAQAQAAAPAPAPTAAPAA